MEYYEACKRSEGVKMPGEPQLDYDSGIDAGARAHVRLFWLLALIGIAFGVTGVGAVVGYSSAGLYAGV